MEKMHCLKCNSEIPQGSHFCCFCGCEQKQEESVEKEVLQTKKSIDKKKITTIVAAIALLLVVLSSILFTTLNTLSDDEKYAVKMVEEYQDMLKDPDSLKLRSDVIVIKSYTEETGSIVHSFFTASGSNSYGANVTSTVCFVDGEYFCDLDDIPDASEYMQMSDSEARKYLLIELRLAQWKL